MKRKIYFMNIIVIFLIILSVTIFLEAFLDHSDNDLNNFLTDVGLKEKHITVVSHDPLKGNTIGVTDRVQRAVLSAKRTMAKYHTRHVSFSPNGAIVFLYEIIIVVILFIIIKRS